MRHTRAALFTVVKATVNGLLALVPGSVRQKVDSRLKRRLRAFGSRFSPRDAGDFLISAVPCVIRLPGRYRLESDLIMAAADGTAIAIDAHHVTIDFMGHALRNSAGAANSAIGIGGADLKDVTLTGGTVSGFRYGVFLRAGKRYRILNMRVEENWHWGISVEGEDCLIRDNDIINTGGSTADAAVCIAMRAFGVRQIVEGNVIRGVRRAPRNLEWVGIHFDNAPNSRLEANIIAAAAQEPQTWGVWVNGGNWGRHGGTHVLVTRNQFVNLYAAGAFVDTAAGTCADNLLINTTESFVIGGPEVRLDDRGGNVRYTRVKLRESDSRYEAVAQHMEAQPPTGAQAARRP